MRARVGLLSFSHTDLKENGSIELDGSDDQVRETWRAVEGKRGEGRSLCDAVRKRRTDDRSESRFQRPVGVRTYVFERERGEESTPGRKTINPFFASSSFHLSSPSTLPRSLLHGPNARSQSVASGFWETGPSATFASFASSALRIHVK